MKIAAAVRDRASDAFRIETLELDEPRDDEVLVRIVASGVCHTDLVSHDRVPLPAVFGHEGAGIVERVGSRVSRVKPGDRVVLSFPSCGACPGCYEGAPYRCDHLGQLAFAGARRDGSSPLRRPNGERVSGAFLQQSSFATHAIATERNTVPIAGDVPLELMGPLGCGIQTGAGAVLNAMKVARGKSVVVFGAGAVGLAGAMAAALVGAAPIVAVDIVPSRLALAREVGATDTIDARAGDVPAKVRAILPRGADYVLETTADAQAFADAFASLAMGAAIALVTVPHRGQPFPFAPRPIVAAAATVHGIIEGQAVPELFVPEMIGHYRRGRFPFDRLVRYYPFADINRAVADSHSGLTVKPILRMDG
jgi:aryl-alcohol dehydrogenase